MLKQLLIETAIIMQKSVCDIKKIMSHPFVMIIEDLVTQHRLKIYNDLENPDYKADEDEDENLVSCLIDSFKTTFFLKNLKKEINKLLPLSSYNERMWFQFWIEQLNKASLHFICRIEEIDNKNSRATSPETQITEELFAINALITDLSAAVVKAPHTDSKLSRLSLLEFEANQAVSKAWRLYSLGPITRVALDGMKDAILLPALNKVLASDAKDSTAMQLAQLELMTSINKCAHEIEQREKEYQAKVDKTINQALPEMTIYNEHAIESIRSNPHFFYPILSRSLHFLNEQEALEEDNKHRLRFRGEKYLHHLNEQLWECRGKLESLLEEATGFDIKHLKKKKTTQL